MKRFGVWSKGLFSGLLAVVLVLGLFAGAPMAAWADSSNTTIDVSDSATLGGTNWTYDTTTKTFTVTGDVTIMGDTGTGSSSNGNRVVAATASGVTANITLNGVNIDVSATASACAFDMTGATVNLTLVGTNALTSGSIRAGLQAPDGSVLTINAANDTNDKLTANGGIGGGANGAGGNITINGGIITAKGVGGGAGIGGGNGGAGGNVTINGGEINANGGGRGAGIGGGDSRAGGNITINGGKITANGYDGGEGIGGGNGGAGGNVTINGGEINANGGGRGAGIGGGDSRAGGNITINGGKITANGYDGGAGIGGGLGNPAGGAGGNIVITGGDVTATSGSSTGSGGGAGIGGGGNNASSTSSGSSGTITITSGAKVTATGGASPGSGGGAGIGSGGAYGNAIGAVDGIIIETGSIVAATGGIGYNGNSDGANIGYGGGYNNNANAGVEVTPTTTVTRHTVTVTQTTGGTIAAFPDASATTVVSGANQTYKITPNAGYKIADITVDGLSVGAVTSVTLPNITDDTRTITATFEQMYGISLSKTGTHDFGSATYSYTAQSPLTVTVTNTGSQATGALTASLSGTNADSFDISNNTATAGISTTSGTATFDITPKTGLAVGTYTATVTVSGGNGITASFGVSFTVDPAMVDTAIAGLTAPVRGAAPVTAVTETAQYTGTVTWTPAVSGTFAASTVYTAEITLTAKANYTLTGVAANYFTVTGATTVTNAADSGTVTAVFPATGAMPPTIMTTSLPNGTAGTTYSQTLTGTGTNPITWNIDSGNLPGGLTLNTDGIITGNPTAAGTATFIVRATNGGGNDTRALSITIDPASADKSALNAALTTANNIVHGGVNTTQAWINFVNARTAADDILNRTSPPATQAEIDTATANLGAATSALKAADDSFGFENGANRYTIGSGVNLAHSIARDWSLHTGLVYVDGQRVTQGTHYTSAAGSTRTTLHASYLDTLSVGPHTLTVEFSAGIAPIVDTFEVVAGVVPAGEGGGGAPATGDDSNMAVLRVALLCAALGMLGLIVWRKRQRAIICGGEAGIRTPDTLRYT